MDMGESIGAILGLDPHQRRPDDDIGDITIMLRSLQGYSGGRQVVYFGQSGACERAWRCLAKPRLMYVSATSPIHANTILVEAIHHNSRTNVDILAILNK
eukprot:TRINITY_DN8057_c0_g1_i1.p4 TRINITY_DN8057_c0_g1~~TRINITY_DN8057_c0_g1_i1.p4  ORF type:complete len:100 (-),score=1.98 TRINITY_DN8057_c0_g1_i1:600-899(-)